MTKRKLAILFTLSIAVLVSTGTAATLVFLDGAAIEVDRIERVSTRVHVWLADGSMQAYEISDIDLAASGLTSRSTPDRGDEPENRELASTRSAFAGGVASEEEPTFTIDDGDVGHVFDEDEEGSTDEAGKPTGTAADRPTARVSIEDVRHRMAGSTVSVEGQVVNLEDSPVGGIVLKASFLNTLGEVITETQFAVPEVLRPHQRAPFRANTTSARQVSSVAVSAVKAEFTIPPARPPNEGGMPDEEAESESEE